MTPELNELFKALDFFIWSEKNKCWPTTKTWTVKEAKEALKTFSDKAKKSLAPTAKPC